VLKGPQAPCSARTLRRRDQRVTAPPELHAQRRGRTHRRQLRARRRVGRFNTDLGDRAACSVYAAQRKRDGFMDVAHGPGRATEPGRTTRTSTRCAASCCWSPATDRRHPLIGDFTSREENCCTRCRSSAAATAT
jgi:hypothetical protein